VSDATRTPARNAALRPCQLTPIGVNSENALAQFTLIRRNRRSSSGFSRNLRQEVTKQEKSYFWRTYTGTEIDIAEEREGGIYAYECKWSRPRRRVPESFLAAYPGASFEVITRESYRAYLGA
jgi:hypothetical protein